MSAYLNSFGSQIQKSLGNSHKLLRLLDLNPMTTEIEVQDAKNQQMLTARIYHVTHDHADQVKSLWSEHAYMIENTKHDALQQPLGIRKLGDHVAFVSQGPTGLDVATLLERVGHLPPEFAVRITIELLKALEAVYAKGSAHFQLSLRDMLIDSSGQVILKNFGLYDMEYEIRRFYGLETLWDLNFISPDLLWGQELTISADIYSVGACLFAMVTGRPPFTGTADTVRACHLEKAPPNPQTMNPEVNIGLARVLGRALAKKSSQRFTHFSEFKEALAFLLPVAERAELLQSQHHTDETYSDADKAKIAHDLAAARSLMSQGELGQAESILDALLMAFGRHEEARALRLELKRQIIAPECQNLLQSTQQAIQQGQLDGALGTLCRLFAKDAQNPQGWTLFSQITGMVRRVAPGTGHNFDLAQLLQKASLATTMGQQALATQLFATVHMCNPKSSEAEQALSQLLGKAASLPSHPPAPAPKAPQVEPAPPSSGVELDDLDADDLDTDLSLGKETELLPVSELFKEISEDIHQQDEQDELEEVVLEIQMLLSKKDFQQALDKSKSALARFPDEPAVKSMLETAARQLEDQTIERAMGKVQQLLQQKDFKGALQVAQGILKLRPDHTGARQAMEVASAHLKAGADLRPLLEQIHQAQTQGTLQKALQLIDQGLQSHPDHADLLRKRDEISRAAEASEEIQWRFSEAQTMVQKGNTEGAIQKLQQLLHLHPQHQPARDLLAQLSANASETLPMPSMAPQPPAFQPQPPPGPPAPGTDTPSTEVHPPQDAPRKRGPGKILVPVGIVLALVIIVAGGVFWKIHADKIKTYADLHQRAAGIEAEGRWEDAVEAWKELVAVAPNHKNASQRLNELQNRIRERDQQIMENLVTAREYIADGTIVDSSDENAVAYLKRILQLDPDNPQAQTLLENIRNEQMQLAVSLFEEERVLEARDAYEQVKAIDERFEDPEFEARVNNWIFERVVAPKLEELDRAVKRKRWDEAFELSDALRAEMTDPAPLEERWNAIFADLQDQVEKAQERNQGEKILDLMQIMVRIRPDDEALKDQRNMLSRELNNAKIANTADKLDRALKASDWARAGLYANELYSLDSEHPLARSGLDQSISRLEGLIATQERTQPRQALQTYDSLIRIRNNRSYRNKRDVLSKKVAEFDQAVNQIKSNLNADYDQLSKRLTQFFEKYPDFKEDPAFSEMIEIESRVNEEHANLQDVLRWEAKVREDDSVSYAEILENLRKANKYRYAFARGQMARLIASYEDRIENFSGGVTLVIRGAQNLPEGNDRFGKAPEAYCVLETSGAQCRTETVDNEHNPVWNQSCTFQAQKGEPLVFKVFDDNKLGKPHLLDTLKLASVPKDGKNMAFKGPEGWTLLLDVRRSR